MCSYVPSVVCFLPFVFSVIESPCIGDICVGLSSLFSVFVCIGPFCIIIFSVFPVIEMLCSLVAQFIYLFLCLTGGCHLFPVIEFL